MQLVSINATAEVNAFRANKGLPPFEEDPCLVLAAQTIALKRAQEHRAGHTPNDFSGLPEGCNADAAGCAALEPSWGWHSCCDSEMWKYGGAAVCTGDDGLRYMQLFVRDVIGRRAFDPKGLIMTLGHPHEGECYKEAE